MYQDEDDSMNMGSVRQKSPSESRYFSVQNPKSQQIGRYTKAPSMMPDGDGNISSNSSDKSSLYLHSNLGKLEGGVPGITNHISKTMNDFKKAQVV